ncbi:DUF2202 domain-containing protein [Thioflexithrix psekupsensis]|uniref:DUF2202 domain-containing protein n=1 Tax=Thioflexithrix psekupsensis TaxID=1570016 RepID=UPI00112242AD|nr:DUF2202 domain-containing protein [Thioflexithrix psekupsensis]
MTEKNAAGSGYSCCGGRGHHGHHGHHGMCGSIALQGGDLLEADKHSILYLHEEEKLARDVYLSLARHWDSLIHQHVSESEQRHIDRIGDLITVYHLDDLLSADVGVFRNTDLQKLYDELVARGQKTAHDALLVGAWVEEADIQDLQQALTKTKNPDLINTYEHLLQASYRHLNLFVRTWMAQSEMFYTAQILPQATVDAILGAGQVCQI